VVPRLWAPNGIEGIHPANGLTADLAKLQQRWEEYLDKHSILDFATIQKRFLDRQAQFMGLFEHVFVLQHECCDVPP
jgi:hypothetical protein